MSPALPAMAVVFSLALLSAQCQDDPDGGAPPPDAGTPDTGPDDGGPSDGGPDDGGPEDTGPVDTGPTDTGAEAVICPCPLPEIDISHCAMP